MLAPKERERLLTAIVAVYAGQDDQEDHRTKPVDSDEAIFPGAFAGMFSEAEEELIAAVNEALARIAAAVSDAPAESPARPIAIVAALGGAEMVTRGEIMAGRLDRLPRLLPDFAYLVTLPHLGEPEAARLRRRARELVGIAGWA